MLSWVTEILVKHLNGQFPTMGVEVHPLKFNTTFGDFGLNIWDTAGKDGLMGLVDGYFIKSDGAIAFYTSTCNYNKTNGMVERFMEINPDSPVINVWNKIDLPEEENFLNENLCHNYDYIIQSRETYQISALSNYNFDKPFLTLLRKLTSNSDLEFC